MPRKKSIVTIDDIDISTIPFQSRTTLAQYVLRALEDRQKLANDMKSGMACQMTLSMSEIEFDSRPVV